MRLAQTNCNSENILFNDYKRNPKNEFFKLEPLKIEFRTVFYVMPLCFFFGIIAGACAVLSFTT